MLKVLPADPRLDFAQPDAKVLGWRTWSIWHGEIDRRRGRSIHDWASVPQDGFQMWVLYYNRRLPDPLGVDRKIIFNFDFYYMAPGLKDYIYWGTNRLDDLKAYPGAIVKYGRAMDEVTFQQIRDEVEEATEWTL